MNSPTLFVARCPVVNWIGDVALYRHTWHGHILRNHSVMFGREEDVRNTILSPTVILESRSVAGSFVLVRDDIRIGRDVLQVPIAPDEERYRVASAYFNANPRRGKVIWP